MTDPSRHLVVDPSRRVVVDREAIRRAYNAFRVGARLRSEDVARLLPGLSNNRLRNMGRDSDRAVPITANELATLISAWADEQRREPSGD